MCRRELVPDDFIVILAGTHAEGRARAASEVVLLLLILLRLLRLLLSLPARLHKVRLPGQSVLPDVPVAEEELLSL